MRTLDELDAATNNWPPMLEIVVGLVCRLPGEGREQPAQAEFSVEDGFVGDRWTSADPPGAQVSLIEHRVAHALLGGRAMELAGDNLIVDRDLSDDVTPPGTRLQIGNVLFEVTDEPHHGCAKFVRRYGLDAQRWVNRVPGRRGRYARVVQAGTVRIADTISDVLG
jgi:MOSC domain-containing protein YiiM